MNSNTSVRKNSKTLYEVIIHYGDGQCWTDEDKDMDALRERILKKVLWIQQGVRIRELCRIDTIEICQYDFASERARCTGLINMGLTDYEM